MNELKQVVYRVRGSLTQDMIPALNVSITAVGGIVNAHFVTYDGEMALFIDIPSDFADEQTADMEHMLRAVLDNKDLILGERMTAEDAAAFSAHADEAKSQHTRRNEHSHRNTPDPNAPAHVQDSPLVAPLKVDENPEGSAQQGPSGKKKKHKKSAPVTMTAAVSAVIISVLIAVLTTYFLTSWYMKSDMPDTIQPGIGQTEKDPFSELDILDRLFKSLSVHELDQDALLVGVLKGYVAATGDRYAAYLTPEEVQEVLKDQNGKLCGIGISVAPTPIEMSGKTYQVAMVANVYAGSPAEKAGVRIGDIIATVGSGDEKVNAFEEGYTKAIDLMRGEKGTTCVFTALRKPDGAAEDLPYEEYESVDISAVRDEIIVPAVVGRVYELDPTVGVVKITSFDNTTAPQFVTEVEKLKEQGCTSFVLDLRNNPGGLLTSVEDLLVYFLQEGDLMITAKNNAGDVKEAKVEGPGKDGKLMCGSHTLTAEDIGRYRDLNFTVLVSEFTASAAELFTANIRDYKLAEIVGVKTYGKGSMQSTIPLAQYGYDGALKLTTNYYYPPCGEGYDGIGITPDVVEELSEEAKKININLLPDDKDNQLSKAVERLK